MSPKMNRILSDQDDISSVESWEIGKDSSDESSDGTHKKKKKKKIKLYE